MRGSTSARPSLVARSPAMALFTAASRARDAPLTASWTCRNASSSSGVIEQASTPICGYCPRKDRIACVVPGRAGPTNVHGQAAVGGVAGPVQVGVAAGTAPGPASGCAARPGTSSRSGSPGGCRRARTRGRGPRSGGRAGPRSGAGRPPAAGPARSGTGWPSRPTAPGPPCRPPTSADSWKELVGGSWAGHCRLSRGASAACTAVSAMCRSVSRTTSPCRSSIRRGSSSIAMTPSISWADSCWKVRLGRSAPRNVAWSSLRVLEPDRGVGLPVAHGPGASAIRVPTTRPTPLAPEESVSAKPLPAGSRRDDPGQPAGPVHEVVDLELDLHRRLVQHPVAGAGEVGQLVGGGRRGLDRPADGGVTGHRRARRRTGRRPGTRPTSAPSSQCGAPSRTSSAVVARRAPPVQQQAGGGERDHDHRRERQLHPPAGEPARDRGGDQAITAMHTFATARGSARRRPEMDLLSARPRRV